MKPPICKSLAYAVTVLSFGLTTADGIAISWSTFGDGDQFDQGNAYSIRGSTAEPFYQSIFVAVPLPPMISGRLETINLATAWSFMAPVGTDLMIVNLVEDNAGLPSGRTLESLTSPISGLLDPVVPSIQTLTSVSHPLMVAEQGDWITVLPGAEDTNGAWFGGASEAAPGWPLAYDNGDGWELLGVQRFTPSIRITAMAVPEPPALALVGTWLALLLSIQCSAVKHGLRRGQGCEVVG